MNAYTTLLTKQTGAVLKITANRPDVLNAQSRILLEELELPCAIELVDFKNKPIWEDGSGLSRFNLFTSLSM